MPLISLRFFALALTAILCSALVPGRARAIIFFFLNLIFVYSYLTPAGMASTIAFCGAGYVFIRLALAGKKWALPRRTLRARGCICLYAQLRLSGSDSA